MTINMTGLGDNRPVFQPPRKIRKSDLLPEDMIRWYCVGGICTITSNQCKGKLCSECKEKSNANHK
jgi:hypothetical protein